MSQGSPIWSTGSNARVRGVIFARHVLGIDIVGAGIDVGENRRGPDVSDHIYRRDESERRHDHFVARPDPPSLEHEEGTRGPG